MVAFTYNTLVTALLAYTEDQSDEFSANLGTIIKNGQEKVIRDLNLEIFKQTYTGSFTSGSNLVNKPEGMLAITTFYYIDTGNSNRWVQLEPRTYDFCIQYSGGENFTGTVKYYDEGFSDTQVFVSNAPTSAIPWRMRGLRRPNYISDTQSENWVSKYAGDLLLYACLIEAESFLFATQEGKVTEWRNEYDGRLPRARNELAQIAKAEYSPVQSNQQPRNDE